MPVSYYAKRESDSVIHPISEAVAMSILSTPSGEIRGWLALWAVDAAWEAAGEGLFRAQSGWADLVWDWGRGRIC